MAAFPGYRKVLADAIVNYEPLIASDRERALYLTVKASADEYFKLLDPLISALTRGNAAAAATMVSTRIRPLTNRMEGEIKALTDFNNDGAALAGQYATDTYSSGLWMIIGLIAGVVVLVALATLLTKSITTPIGDALSIAERIAASDLSKEVQVSGTDEAGRLLKALAQMQKIFVTPLCKLAIHRPNWPPLLRR